MIRKIILVFLLAKVMFLLSSGMTLSWADEFDDRLSLTLPLIQGALIVGLLSSPHGVDVGDRSLEVTPKGNVVFGLGRDFAENLTIILTTPEGQTLEKTFPVIQRQYTREDINGIPKQYVEPDLAAQTKIKQEVMLVSTARKQSLPLQSFLEYFQWPVIGRISGVYGSQRFINGQARRPHYGVDIAAPRGVPVKAPASGQVTLVHPDMFYSGGTVILDHGYGVSSTFLHLDAIDVQEGEALKQGQVLGRVGSTGRSTGPHLDWRVNWFSQRLDPELLVGDMP